MWYRNLSDDIVKKYDIICHPMSWIPTLKVLQLVKFLTRWNMHSSDGTKFYNNDKIVSLRALRYFNIKVLDNDIFRGIPNLREVWIPSTVKSHWYRTFLDSVNIKTVVICSEIPFTDREFFNINTSNQIPSGLKIYVPDSALARYREAWKDFPYLSRLYPLSEYHS